MAHIRLVRRLDGQEAVIHPHTLRRMACTVRPAGQQHTGTVRSNGSQRIGPQQDGRIGAMPAGAEAEQKQGKQEGTTERMQGQGGATHQKIGFDAIQP